MNKMRSLRKLLMICIYLLAGNVFVHAVSMNMIETAGEVEMVMSDCGMMMPSHVASDELPTSSCFEKCMGAYDDAYVAFFELVDGTYHTCQLHHGIFGKKIAHHNQNYDAHAPPDDDRRLIVAKHTPYFSHKTTTKVE